VPGSLTGVLIYGARTWQLINNKRVWDGAEGGSQRRAKPRALENFAYWKSGKSVRLQPTTKRILKNGVHLIVRVH